MSETETPTIEDLRAKVFRDREREGDWRVEKMDDDGGIELAQFSGGDARQRAITYADRVYGEFDEIEQPYHRAPDLVRVLDDLRRSGIPANINLLPRDAGYAFTLGAEGYADTIVGLVLGLCANAIKHFPDRTFAAQYRRTTL